MECGAHYVIGGCDLAKKRSQPIAFRATSDAAIDSFGMGSQPLPEISVVAVPTPI
jgi:hypothetical protein